MIDLDARDPFAPRTFAEAGETTAIPEPGEKPVAVHAFERANFLAREDRDALPVLALDLGTNCGFALRTRAGVTSGTLNLTQRTRDTRGDRLLRFWRFLFDVQQATPLAWVAHEDVQGGGGPGQWLAAHSYAQFEGVLMLFAARVGIDVKAVHTGTLKKAITGRGAWPSGESKPALMRAVQSRGYTPSGQDEADACAVLEYFVGEHVAPMIAPKKPKRPKVPS